MKMPIPTDWDGTSFCDFLVKWPNSSLWRMILRGLISNPSIDVFWDERTGDVADVIAAFSATSDQNIDSLECVPMRFPVGSIILYGGASAPDGWLLCDGSTYLVNDYPDLFNLIGWTYGGYTPEETEFSIPNLGGRVPVGFLANGLFGALGGQGGEDNHVLTTSEMPSHNHTQDSHNHTQNSHNHTQNSHNHTQDSHSHVQATRWNSGNVGGGSGGLSSGASVNFGPTGPTSGSTTATNQAATATNQAATATNQAATATNQAAGGGSPHNNLQPYLVLNYIIRYDPS